MAGHGSVGQGAVSVLSTSHEGGAARERSWRRRTCVPLLPHAPVQGPKSLHPASRLQEGSSGGDEAGGMTAGVHAVPRGMVGDASMGDGTRPRRPPTVGAGTTPKVVGTRFGEGTVATSGEGMRRVRGDGGGTGKVTPTSVSVGTSTSPCGTTARVAGVLGSTGRTTDWGGCPGGT